ncbi:MAG TPA: glycerol-3-phosphate dehydrogenase/oxidase [Gemmatimonadaceae bacterium]
MIASGVRRDLFSLARSPFDVLVIGGGIVGACTARDAALRGLSVALVERDDFCGGISWNSLKIVHGGLRSLQSLDIAQARHFVRERRAWLTVAPHLVEPLPFVVPTRGAGRESELLMRAGIALNDIVSRDRNYGVSTSRRLSRGRAVGSDELHALAPRAFPDYRHGVLFHDAQLYSAERLVMAVLDDAVRAGAVIANYVEAVAPLLERGVLVGAVVEDRIGGGRFDVHASMLVNASGAGAEEVASRFTRRAHVVAPMTGIALNLVLEGDGGTTAYAIVAHDDQRMRRLFVVPWRGRTIVGTAHFPCAGTPTNAAELEPYVERFLGDVAAAWTARSVSRADVLLVHAGMQPPHDAQGPPRHLIVDHARDDTPQLLSAVGPKLTTSRAIAEKLVDMVGARVGRIVRSCETATRLLASAPSEDVATLVTRALARDGAGLPDDVVTHLVRSYGSGYEAIMAMVRERPGLGERVDASSPVIAAQLEYGVREEMAFRADDLLSRRTELGQTARATARARAIAGDQLRLAESSPGFRGSRSL